MAYSFNKSKDIYYSIRKEMHEGKNHIVVPVVMMVEGVHCGSAGSVLHTIDELGKFPESWNGIPVTIDHPTQEGTPISANSPEVIEQRTVGRVYHTHVDGKKLKAECWLDEVKLQNVSELAMQYIEKGWPLDVSVGVFTDSEETKGEWNGETYHAIARNHRPDHLALLPGSTGACSWKDGCGIRINQEGGSSNVTLEELLTQLSERGLSVHKTDVSHAEIESNLRGLISGRAAGNNQFLSIQEVFDDYFVYAVYDFSDNELSGETLYKQSYFVNKSGEVELNGEPIRVKRQVNFVAMAMKRGGKAKMDKTKKVTMLIQYENSPFEESNREMLESLEDSQLDKLIEMAESKAEPKAPEINAEKALEVLRSSLQSPEQFISLLPEEMRDQFQSGLQLHKEKRESLIAQLKAYKSNPFSDEELQSKSTVELEKLTKLIPVEVNYAPLGSHGSQPQANSEEILLPIGLEEEK